MNKVSLMKIPKGFKIKSKSDVEKFMNECMQVNNTYEVKISGVEKIIIEKTKNHMSFMIKLGDIRDPFIPDIEVAKTNAPQYKHDVQYWIWKYRKYINARWFNGKKIKKFKKYEWINLKTRK